MTIMIIEDEKDNLNLLNTFLKIEGYRIKLISDSRLALQEALNEKPDLVISDVAMPFMGGYEILYRFKTHEELNQIPFIIMTAFGELKQGQINPDGFISKPFGLENLSKLVKELLNNK